MAYFIAFFEFGWFFLAGLSDRPVELVAHYIPGWVGTLTWASWLVFLPMVSGVGNVAVSVRVLLAILFFISSPLVSVAFRYYPSISLLVAAGMFVDGLWLRPRWKTKFPGLC
jgi:hypothetical protein